MELNMPSTRSVKTPPLTSAQIRAARALIRWSAEDLAEHSGVSVTTIRRAELMPSATSLTRVNDHVIRSALENAGVEFIDEIENGGGPGVRILTSRGEH
jgi:transcriptional regulator with XRE-family HTH domain